MFIHVAQMLQTVSFLLQMSLPNITLYMHQYSALYVYKYGSFLVLTVWIEDKPNDVNIFLCSLTSVIQPRRGPAPIQTSELAGYANFAQTEQIQ